MRVLITGYHGYIGPVVARHLKQRHESLSLVGWDNDYFAECNVQEIRPLYSLFDQRIHRDLRDVTADDLHNIDAIVHLAAISNDPIGNQFEAVTEDVNVTTTKKLAEMASAAGVKRFIFASSCSMYGAGAAAPRKETDDLNPLTAYARSKVAAEKALKDIAGDMQVTCLRFSTAYGFAPLLRLDLVINDFVASAVTTGKIEVLSDGSPWRPLIHVSDMARAIDWALQRKGDAYLAMNTGSENSTWQMGQLAKDIGGLLGKVDVSINTDAPPDKRSYQVDFSLFKELAPDHQPVVSFETAVKELRDGVKLMDFEGNAFRESRFIRLHWLRRLLDEKKLDNELRWTEKKAQ